MSKYLTFRCKCGDTELEEIMVNVMCTSTFQRVEVKGDGDGEDPFIRPDYQDNTNDDGQVSRYQCSGCGMVLKMPQEAPDGIVVDNADLLVQWLKQYRQPKENNGKKQKR